MKSPTAEAETDHPELPVADPVARRRVLRYGITLVALGLLLLAVGVPAWLAWLRFLAQRDTARGLRWARATFHSAALLLGAGPAVAGGLLIRHGERTLRHGRFPPPGVVSLRPVPVLRGPAAARRGRALLLLGWLLVALGAVLLFMVERLLTTLIPPA